ncbi:uncharacterized protein LOC141912182 [Tubulanus polymorphus]|uniref:uncharacterized protein LOC141912182 n=1 Tax=Tubulanus polymorphus TaxID=672921 RepID=UPI003DA52F10
MVPNVGDSEIGVCRVWTNNGTPNKSNLSSATTGGSSELAELDVLISGSVTFVLILPLVLFYWTRFPLGSTGAVLLGAVLTVALPVLAQDDVYVILGHKDNLRTIFLLLGMMLIAQYFHRERLVDKILNKILNSKISIEIYIFKVSAISFVFSMFFTNDAACVILTPLILDVWRRQRRHSAELLTLLLAVSTSSNIGTVVTSYHAQSSVVTIFGNPLMALIASKTDSPLYEKSVLNLQRSIVYMGPPAVVGAFLNVGFLIVHYRARVCHRSRKQRGLTKVNVDGADELESVKLNLFDSSDSNKDRNRPGSNPDKSNEYSAASVEDNKDATIIATERENPVPIVAETNRSVPNVPHNDELLTDEENHCPDVPIAPHHDRTDLNTVDDALRPSESVLFHVVLCLVVLLIVCLLLISSTVFKFDVGLVPMCGAIVIIVADALINRRNSSAIIEKIDWGILLLFMGIFVWMRGFNSTHLPRWFWNRLGLVATTVVSAREILIFSVFVLLGTNVFNNIPLTLIVLEQMAPCQNQLALVLYLGWWASVGGNLTQFGSVSNLIVAQKAQSTLDYRLNFLQYLKYGFITTLIIGGAGTFIIYGLLQIQWFLIMV